MKNKLKLQKLGDNSLWVLQQVGNKGFKITDIVLTSYIQAFLPQLKLSSDGKGYIERIVRSLERNGTVTKNSDNSYRLTSKGRWEMARRRMLDDSGKHTKDYWDKKWRIVIFDIPELERQHRDVLRYAIKKYGMRQLQHSVWVYPYACNMFIDSIKKDLGFNAEVLFIMADNIENQSKLEEEFELR